MTTKKSYLSFMLIKHIEREICIGENRWGRALHQSPPQILPSYPWSTEATFNSEASGIVWLLRCTAVDMRRVLLEWWSAAQTGWAADQFALTCSIMGAGMAQVGENILCARLTTQRGRLVVTPDSSRAILQEKMSGIEKVGSPPFLSWRLYHRRIAANVSGFAYRMTSKLM